MHSPIANVNPFKQHNACINSYLASQLHTYTYMASYQYITIVAVKAEEDGLVMVSYKTVIPVYQWCATLLT